MSAKTSAPDDLAALSASLIDAVRQAIADHAPQPVGLLIPQVNVPGYLGISRAAMFRLRSADDFPRPVRLDGVGVVYRRSDLDKWAERLRPAHRKPAAIEA